jgi:hypothetical protein
MGRRYLICRKQMALPCCGVRFELRLFPHACLAFFAAAAVVARAADATSPLDPAARNAPYAPANTVAPEKQNPNAQLNSRLQEQRFETSKVERKMAPVGDRRAPIALTESQEKSVREKQTRTPERIDQPTSAYNQRQSGISTANNTTKPPTVAKYQDSLNAASATNMARFPALEGASSAKINRFVFRKNSTDPDRALEGATVTPAAGGSALRP